MLQEGLALLSVTVPTPVYPRPSSKPATGGLPVSVAAAIMQKAPADAPPSLWNSRGLPEPLATGKKGCVHEGRLPDRALLSLFLPGRRHSLVTLHTSCSTPLICL